MARLSSLSLLGLVLDRLFSLALLAVVAAVYGVTADTDSYYLALIVPAALGFSLTEAAYTAFLPFFGGAEAPSMRRLHASLRIGIPVGLLVTAAYVVVVLAVRPGHLGVWLAFAGLVAAQPAAGIYAAFFTAHRWYGVATLRVPFVTGVAFAAALVLLAAWGAITAVAVAVTIGQIAQLPVLEGLARRCAVPGGRSVSPGLRILAPAASVFLATLVGGQLIVLIERFLASTLTTGSVTLLVNARGLVLVAAMAAQALATGVFPAASERFRALGRDSLAELTSMSVRLASLIALVATAYVALCRRELIQVVLERGEFGAEDTNETAQLVAIMAPSLLGVSTAAVAGKALFGIGKQRFVAVVSGAGVALYTALAAGLREVWSVEGLAAAFLISSLVTGAILAIAVARAVALRPGAVARDWIAVPAGLASVFAAAVGGVWLGLGRGAESLGGAIATLVTAGAAGLLSLGIALIASRAREWELLRAALVR